MYLNANLWYFYNKTLLYRALDFGMEQLKIQKRSFMKIGRSCRIFIEEITDYDKKLNN